MPRDARLHSATTLRCNDCGYLLAGLPESEDCPECGRSVASSLPKSRRGSAWQRVRLRSGPRFVGAVIEPLVHAGSFWSAVRPERVWRSVGLLALSSVIASGVFALAVLIGGPRTGHGDPLYVLAFWVVGALVFAGLSFLEASGLALVGWRHGWNRTPAHLLAIVGHASPGWIVGGMSAGVAWLALQRIDVVWESPVLRIGGQTVLPEGGAVGAALLVSGGLGLVVFEWLAYRGLKSLRYASRIERD